MPPIIYAKPKEESPLDNPNDCLKEPNKYGEIEPIIKTKERTKPLTEARYFGSIVAKRVVIKFASNIPLPSPKPARAIYTGIREEDWPIQKIKGAPKKRPNACIIKREYLDLRASLSEKIPPKIIPVNAKTWW